MPSNFLILCLVLSAAIAAQASTQPRCYFPDGSVDTAGYICNSTAADAGGVSACCLADDVCYESGTCFQGWSGVTYRQSCTDPSWKDPNCPQMCLGKGQLDLGVWVQTCDVAKGKACCVKDDQCCNDTTNWFDYKPGYLVAVISGDGSNRLGPYIAADAVVSPSSSVSPSSTPTPAGNSSSVSSQSQASATDTCATHGRSKTPTNAVAIGVGVVFGTAMVLACAGLIFVLTRFLREKRQRLVAIEHLARLQEKMATMMMEEQESKARLNQQYSHGYHHHYAQPGTLSEMPDYVPVSELAAGERH